MNQPRDYHQVLGEIRDAIYQLVQEVREWRLSEALTPEEAEAIRKDLQPGGEG